MAGTRIYSIEVRRSNRLESLPLPPGRLWLPLSEAVVYILEQAPAIGEVRVELKRSPRNPFREWDTWTRTHLRQLEKVARQREPGRHHTISQSMT